MDSESHMWDKSLVFSNLFTFSSFQICRRRKLRPKPIVCQFWLLCWTRLCALCAPVCLCSTPPLCALVRFNLVTLNTSLCASRSPFGLSIWILVSAPAGRDTCLPLLLSLSCPPSQPSVAQWSTNAAQFSTMVQCPPIRPSVAKCSTKKHNVAQCSNVLSLRLQEDLVAALTMKSKVAEWIYKRCKSTWHTFSLNRLCFSPRN